MNSWKHFTFQQVRRKILCWGNGTPVLLDSFFPFQNRANWLESAGKYDWLQSFEFQWVVFLEPSNGNLLSRVIIHLVSLGIFFLTGGVRIFPSILEKARVNKTSTTDVLPANAPSITICHCQWLCDSFCFDRSKGLTPSCISISVLSAKYGMAIPLCMST